PVAVLECQPGHVVGVHEQRAGFFDIAGRKLSFIQRGALPAGTAGDEDERFRLRHAASISPRLSMNERGFERPLDQTPKMRRALSCSSSRASCRASVSAETRGRLKSSA